MTNYIKVKLRKTKTNRHPLRMQTMKPDHLFKLRFSSKNLHWHSVGHRWQIGLI